MVVNKKEHRYDIRYRTFDIDKIKMKKYKREYMKQNKSEEVLCQIA